MGILIITGCGHTGIINAVKHAQTLLNISNTHLLMGGFHLAGPQFADRITPTLTDLQAINPSYIVTGHCTGRMMQAELTKTFGHKHVPYGVGARMVF